MSAEWSTVGFFTTWQEYARTAKSDFSQVYLILFWQGSLLDVSHATFEILQVCYPHLLLSLLFTTEIKTKFSVDFASALLCRHATHYYKL